MAKITAMEREIISPVRRNSFRRDRLAAMQREMAVWIPDEVRENSRVWIGKRRR